MPTTIRFDTEHCARCGGTGQHSFNLRDGSRCWGCGGSGKALTAAGSNAKERLAERRPTVALPDVKVGDRILIPGTRGWRTVTESAPDQLNEGRWSVVTVSNNGDIQGYGGFMYSTVRRAMTEAEHAEYLQFAATLDGVEIVES